MRMKLLRRSRPLIRSGLLLLVLLFSSHSPGEVYYDLGLGYSGGTFTTEKSFPISGPAAGMQVGYYWPATPGLQFALGGAGRYSVLNQSPDGIKKSGNLYQAGLSGAALLFLGESFHLQLGACLWSYSKFYLFSDVKSSVNDEEYRTQSFTFFDGGQGGEATLGFMSESRRKGRNSLVRYGLVFGYETVTFTSKSERVVVTRPGVEKSDSTTVKPGTYNLALATIQYSLGLVF